MSKTESDKMISDAAVQLHIHIAKSRLGGLRALTSRLANSELKTTIDLLDAKIAADDVAFIDLMGTKIEADNAGIIEHIANTHCEDIESEHVAILDMLTDIRKERT